MVTRDARDGAAPLAGATVLVTRDASRADALVAPLEALGARVLTWAATRIERRDTAALQAALRELRAYDWVLFTSATAVAITVEVATAVGVTVSEWAGVRVACVGAATAGALRAHGVEATLVPERFLAAGLLEALAARDDIAGARVLHPVATGARGDLVDGLRALGASVHRIDAYESVAGDADVAELRNALQNGRVDAVTFAAGSAVAAWVGAMAPLHAAAPAVSIGPVTTQAAHAAGLHVAAEASPSTLEGLVAAVVRAVGARHDQHHPTPTT